MVWPEDDRDKLAVRTFEIVCKISASVKSLKIFCPCSVTFCQDALDDIVALVVP